MPSLAQAAPRIPAVTISYNGHLARSFEALRLKDPKKLSDLAYRIASKASVTNNMKLLDLGCGTGFYTLGLAQRLDAQVTGADVSEDMLKIAMAKPGADKIKWVKEDASKLSFENESFDVVFMSSLLHHFDNPLDILEQCMRVLRPGGLLINQYGALEDILCDPDHKFFPDAVEVDVRRTPARLQLEYLFSSIGLSQVNSEKATYKLCGTAQERVDLVAEKYISVFHLINEMSFQRGLKELRAYAAANSFDPWLRELKITTTTGMKL